MHVLFNKEEAYQNRCKLFITINKIKTYENPVARRLSTLNFNTLFLTGNQYLLIVFLLIIVNNIIKLAIQKYKTPVYGNRSIAANKKRRVN